MNIEQAKEQIADLELNINKAADKIDANGKAKEVLLDVLVGTHDALDRQYDRNYQSLDQDTARNRASIVVWEHSLADTEIKLSALENPPVVEDAVE